jgi:hypothetical protein
MKKNYIFYKFIINAVIILAITLDLLINMRKTAGRKLF